MRTQDEIKRDYSELMQRKRSIENRMLELCEEMKSTLPYKVGDFIKIDIKRYSAEYSKDKMGWIEAINIEHVSDIVLIINPPKKNGERSKLRRIEYINPFSDTVKVIPEPQTSN